MFRRYVIKKRSALKIHYSNASRWKLRGRAGVKGLGGGGPKGAGATLVSRSIIVTAVKYVIRHIACLHRIGG